MQWPIEEEEDEEEGEAQSVELSACLTLLSFTAHYQQLASSAKSVDGECVACSQLATKLAFKTQQPLAASSAFYKCT